MVAKAKADPSRDYATGYKNGKAAAEHDASPVVDEFGETAKVIVIAAGIAVGAIVALFIVWNFIHWAATPDLSRLEGTLQSQGYQLDNIEGRIGALSRAQISGQTSNQITPVIGTPSTNGLSITPGPSSCSKAHDGTVTCH